MDVPFKFKVFCFSVIEKYKLYNFLKFLQRYVTFRAKEDFKSQQNYWDLHLNCLKDIRNSDIVALEIGGGQSLSQNIFLSKYVSKQVVVDIDRLLNIDYTNSAIKYIYGTKAELVSNEIDLQRVYNISYIAPHDITHSVFADSTFDVIYNTNTFEHIPKNELIQVIKAFFNLLKEDGILSIIIDYTDHYSHTDSSIDKFNFRRYSEDEWLRYNFKIHYQNRLKHSDYIEILNEAGFNVFSVSNVESSLIVEKDIPVSDYSGSHIVCRKRKFTV